MKYALIATRPDMQGQHIESFIVSSHKSFDLAEKALDKIHPNSITGRDYCLDIEQIKTKYEAVEHAKELTGELYRLGDSYRFNVWPNGIKKLGYESKPDNYFEAKANRSQCLISLACDFMGIDQMQYNGGKWTDYLPQYKRVNG